MRQAQWSAHAAAPVGVWSVWADSCASSVFPQRTAACPSAGCWCAERSVLPLTINPVSASLEQPLSSECGTVTEMRLIRGQSTCSVNGHRTGPYLLVRFPVLAEDELDSSLIFDAFGRSACGGQLADAAGAYCRKPRRDTVKWDCRWVLGTRQWAGDPRGSRRRRTPLAAGKLQPSEVQRP